MNNFSDLLKEATETSKLKNSLSAKYRRLRPGDAMYEMVKANNDAGNWACDAWTHNSNEGCSNPVCFKYVNRRKR
jgi:hypothetical protein